MSATKTADGGRICCGEAAASYCVACDASRFVGFARRAGIGDLDGGRITGYATAYFSGAWGGRFVSVLGDATGGRWSGRVKFSLWQPEDRVDGLVIHGRRGGRGAVPFRPGRSRLRMGISSFFSHATGAGCGRMWG